MSRKRTLFVVLLAVLVLAVSVTSAVAKPGKSRTFKARLTGSQEVPAVSTAAKGNAKIVMNKSGTMLKYRVTVRKLSTEVTGVHIHVGARGENGPVVVDLGPGRTGKTKGLLTKGRITAGDLTGPLAGMTVADLLAEMRAGNAYVTVHTTTNPDGEIRGQLYRRGGRQ
jgi:hypothetical protein